ITTVGGTTYTDNGLTQNTTYDYTVKAVDSAGNVSLPSSSVTATTLNAADTTPPSAPTNLTATTVSATQVDISWSASTDNVGVTGYQVYRRTALITTVGSTTYTDTGLTPNTTYDYTVKAADAAGNISLPSTPLTVTTLNGADTTPP